MSIYKKGQKDGLGSYRPMKPNLGSGQDYGRYYPECRDMQDNQGIRISQHRFMKGRSYLTSLIFFYNKVIHLVEEGW